VRLIEQLTECARLWKAVRNEGHAPKRTTLGFWDSEALRPSDPQTPPHRDPCSPHGTSLQSTVYSLQAAISINVWVTEWLTEYTGWMDDWQATRAHRNQLAIKVPKQNKPSPRRKKMQQCECEWIWMGLRRRRFWLPPQLIKGFPREPGIISVATHNSRLSGEGGELGS